MTGLVISLTINPLLSDPLHSPSYPLLASLNIHITYKFIVKTIPLAPSINTFSLFSLSKPLCDSQAQQIAYLATQLYLSHCPPS